MSTIGQNLRSTVLVGNISPDAAEEPMKDMFAQIGPVANFKFFYDKESGKPKGYAVCEYRDPDAALNAVRSLSGYEVKGKILRVDIASSERCREELKNLQMSSGGPPGDNSRDGEIEPEKAPEAISKAVASLPPEQMFELMKQMKMCIQNNPNEARNLLLQNPQLAYALLQAQVVMRIVDPQVALNILNRANPNPVSSTSAPSSESETVKTTASATSTKASTTTTSVFPGPASSSPADSVLSNVPTSALPLAVSTSSSPLTSFPLTNVSASDGPRVSAPPLRNSQMGDIRGPPLLGPEVPRPGVPSSRHHPQRGIDSFGPFGDPRSLADRDMRIPPRGDIGDVRLPARVDQDMRQPSSIGLGDLDMRQPMGDQDFRMMRGVQMMDSRPYDPRLRSMTSGESLGRPTPSAAPYDQRGAHPFDPRTAHETRPSAPPQRLEDPRTLAAMRSQVSSRAGSTTTSTSSILASLPSIGNSRPSSNIIAAANAIAPHDQEKAALIMQVLQLSDEQIAMLPPEQRQSILILKEQIARSCPP